MATTTSQELAILDIGEQLLLAAASLDEIKTIRDRAELARVYARTAREGIEVQNRAAKLRLQAERKAGRLLANLRLRGGDRRSKHRQRLPTLAQVGITKHQSQRWQLLASVPENVFYEYVEAAIRQGREVAAAPLLRFASEPRPAPSALAATPDEETPEQGLTRVDGVHQHIALPLSCVSEMRSHCQIVARLLEPGAAATEPSLSAGQIRHIRRLVNEIGVALSAVEAESVLSPPAGSSRDE